MWTTVRTAARRAVDEVYKATGRHPTAIGIQLDEDSFARTVFGWSEAMRVFDDAEQAAQRAIEVGMLQVQLGDFKLEIRRKDS